MDVFAADEHVMRANAVIKERQRMQQNAISFTAEQVRQWISERRTSWEHHLDKLGDYLAEYPDE